MRRKSADISSGCLRGIAWSRYALSVGCVAPSAGYVNTISSQTALGVSILWAYAGQFADPDDIFRSIVWLDNCKFEIVKGTHALTKKLDALVGNYRTHGVGREWLR
jgi:hypothetical protein